MGEHVRVERTDLTADISFDKPMGICPHCGTIKNAVTVWTDFEIEGCPCMCHYHKKLYADEKPRRGKRK